jgi:hypothetical protein
MFRSFDNWNLSLGVDRALRIDALVPPPLIFASNWNRSSLRPFCVHSFLTLPLHTQTPTGKNQLTGARYNEPPWISERPMLKGLCWPGVKSLALPVVGAKDGRRRLERLAGWC